MDLTRINELGFEKTSKWKSIVLILSFSKWWNLLIAIQSYIIFILCLYNLAFHERNVKSIVLRYVCDFFYLIEVICTISHRTNARFKKLKHSFGRRWFFIILDIFSLIPLEVFYYFHYVSDESGKHEVVANMMVQNRLLRIYRIFQLESLYGITVSKQSRYIVFMFLLFASKAVLLAHILCCVWVNIEHSVTCNPRNFTCPLWYESNMANLVILNWSGRKESLTKPWERFLVTIGIFLGVLLIYAYFYPFTFLASMQLHYSRALFYDRYRKLLRLLHNMIENKDVRKKILQDFIDAWRSVNDVQSYLGNLPLALQKEVFTDIYWDAFRHSQLLRSVSRSCKRSLSLAMTTSYFHSGEVVYLKGQMKAQMLFLIQGIVQVMAEENEKSPLLSFSSGTMFGELSLFIHTHSQAILKCKSYCEFQTLTMQRALRVLKNYPRDKKQVYESLQQRLLMGRYTQWRKNEFRPKEKGNLGVESTVEDCVKWIKIQWSAVWEGHKRQQAIIKAIEEGRRIPSFQRRRKPEGKIEFISNFLELIVLSDAFEEKEDAVCLRTTFPWSIDPSAYFLRIWFNLVLVTSFIPVLLYPLCTVWLRTFPRTIYQLSYIITLIYIVDVILKLLTAVRTRHVIHTQFLAVLRHRLKEPTFYLDVLAALPYQIFIIFNLNSLTSYEIGLLLHPAILKFHVFITLKVHMNEYMTKLVFLKIFSIFIFLLYLYSEIVQLFFVSVHKGDRTKDTWIDRFLSGRENAILRENLISVLSVLTNAISIADFFMYPDRNVGVVLQCITKYFFFFFSCYFLGYFYGFHVIKIFSQETFLALLKRIIKFLNSIYLPKNTSRHLLKTVKFQWQYDNADYLSSDIPTIKAFPFDLRKQVYSESAYKTLRSCKIFHYESLECLVNVMEKSFMVAVPAGSLLVSYGHTSHMLSILHRGMCQLNSFLEADTNAGLGWSVLLEPGSAFPLLSTLCNLPAPVAVVSVTDCEVIMIHLEDLIKIFIDFGIIKDICDVLSELDLLRQLSAVTPGLIGFAEIDRSEKSKRVLKRQKYPPWLEPLAICLNLCSRAKSVEFVKKWEAFYFGYLVALSAIWPTCFGLFAYASHVLLPVLLCSKIIIIINMIIRFQSPYYNKIGVLVTHPLYTFRNYLSSALFIDVLCIFPVFTVYRYKVISPTAKLPNWLVLLNFLQHFLKMIHILGYLDNLEYVLNSKYAIRMIKIVLSVLIAFNSIVNFMMYVLADWIYGSPYRIVGFVLPAKYCPDNPKLLRKNSLIDYYLFISYWMLCNLNTNGYELNLPREILLYASYILNIIGTVLHFYIYCLIASNSLFTYFGEILFQEKITSFVKFLELEDANAKVIEHALSYYNYEWSKTRGENLKNIFERLPTFLHEELTYPLYRSTLSKLRVLADADEGFYKILAKYITCVYFNRGSVIIFKNEVQSNLYFLHKGKCFVYDWFLILEKGSLVGDIKRTGVMENNVYALTNVEMLKITADDFFTVVNNFDGLEEQFLATVKVLENFIENRMLSYDFQLHPVDSKDVLHAFRLQGKDIGFEDESFFEETDKSSVLMRKTLKYKEGEKKKWIFIIYPDSWFMNAFVSLLQVDAFLTVVSVPTLASFGALTKEAFIAVGLLDLFWFVGIVLSFRVGYIDKVKGDIITDFKFVAKYYMKRWDGFFVDVLALVPFELFYLASCTGFGKVNPATVSWLRCFRLLRGLCLLRNVQQQSQKLKTNHYLAYTHIVLYMVMGMFFFANALLLLSNDPDINSSRNPHNFNRDQFFIFVTFCEHVVNLFASSNLEVLVPDSRSQIIFSIMFALLSPYMKGILISQSLSLMHGNGLVKFNYKSQVVALESFLESSDTSPAIIKSVLDYKFHLLDFGRSENMPAFLVKCPTHLRISIMRDLYLSHLTGCALFENVDTIFLEQLLARMTREVYFSGQLIVEKFDVDHRLYFIHRGEVYVMNQTKEMAYVEFVVGIMVSGQHFGEASGLWFARPHSYTYRARTLVEVIVLHSDAWMDLRRSFPKTAELILAKAKALKII